MILEQVPLLWLYHMASSRDVVQIGPELLCLELHVLLMGRR